MRKIIFALTLVPAFATAAMAAGNEEAGHRLAQQWCMSCHQVEPGQTSAKDVAPTFVSLANDHGKDLNWVRNYLFDPHLPMIGINLSRVQVDNIVAYMQTLQRKE